MKAKYKVLFGVSALALLVTAAPAMANGVDVVGDNSNTGADSRNNNDYDIRDNGDVDLRNRGDVDNVARATVDTGNNDQDRNTEAGDLDTGSVDATTDWESVLNEGASLFDEAGSIVLGDFTNDTTGADSRNNNDLDVRDNSDLSLRNFADVMNRLGLNADTGNNTQEKNTTAGDIDTGSVGVDSDIVNEANNDSGFLGADAGGLFVDVVGDNGTTGADSHNNNDFDIRHNGDTTVRNRATLDTVVGVTADTGNNVQKKNTTGGDLTTGGVEVTTDVENYANNGSGLEGASGNETIVIGDFSNDTTGADSRNNNDLDVRDNSDVTVDNRADVDNTLSVNADTGNNEQEKNTEAGSIDTGDVNIDFGSTTEVNSSL